MPTYDYRCPSNGVTLEVRHGMDECVRTWGELCRLAGHDPGETPEDAPVERLISGAGYISSASRSEPEPAGGCCGGVCGL
ncbi:MAG: zinc ribbon domain-containing protein [Halorhodospira halophila]|uniref:zinc ribbon domain-containing protein n=1 Tax=Halorhodospira TaxID=85108 RepID=UPI0019112E1C|nr:MULTISPECIES: zinc ribbon domain-containing protein [Halorhodospira]MBK5937487.1 regulator [Halorhodospira halophila]MBK5942530.1 regulator [Halorhodospira halophila]MCC3750985.1 zinc ribbon domain-containing protein [Halorhodospira halophila]MCG5529245.1 zinc ribbon domain-containing protein [Halorhodospira halophila]MCG5534080.1 zinc ribbon domain-containing protein [Halorhodospira sp. 9621]